MALKSIIMFFLGLLVTITAHSQSDNIPSIPGWNREEHNGIFHFFPTDGKINYYLMPAYKNAGPGELENWIKQQALNDIKASSWTDMGTGQSQSQAFGSYYLTTVKDGAGKKLIVMYVAYLRTDKAIRWAKIIYSESNNSNSYVSAAAKHFGMLAKKEGANSSTISRQADNNNKTINDHAGRMAPPSNPGASGIKGVVMHSESTTGVGGIIGYVVRPYLFFSDGTFYGRLDTDPYSLNPSASPRANPGKWGLWQINGKSISIRWEKDGNTSEWTSSRWSWALPAASGEKIEGSFSSISGGGNTAFGGGSITISSKYITFNRNGQFTFESVGGGGYSGIDGSNSAWSSHENAGTYLLTGFRIELRFNNGRVVKNGFNFYDSKKDMLSIGSNVYIKSEK